MKRILFAATAAFALSFAPAFAADGTKLMEQCKKNSETDTITPPQTKEGLIAFCGCLVEKSGDDQALLDEFLVYAKLPGDKRTEEFNAKASQKAKDVVAACTPQAPAQ